MEQGCRKIQVKEIFFPDTNIILRYLLKDNENQYKKISPIFSSIREGVVNAIIISEVLLETYYVLTKVYDVPFQEALEKLKSLLLYKGMIGEEKNLLIEAINYALKGKNVSLLDWILCLKTKKFNGKLLSFEEMLKKKCS